MKKDLRSDIIAHLIKKGNYDNGVDDYLIDLLLDNLEYSDMMKKDFLSNGIIVNIPNGNGITTTKENPSYGTYVKCLYNINQCAKQLGINRNDRLKLKLLEEKKYDDEFDELSKR